MMHTKPQILEPAPKPGEEDIAREVQRLRSMKRESAMILEVDVGSPIVQESHGGDRRQLASPNCADRLHAATPRIARVGGVVEKQTSLAYAAVMRLSLFLVGAAFWTTGCAPALSTFVPAQTTPKGHVRATGGLGVSLPSGQIGDAYDIAKGLAERGETQALSAEEKNELLVKTTSVLLSPPSVGWEIQGRYGVHERVDVGLRYASGALRADSRYTFLAPDKHGELGASVGLGLGCYSFEVPVPPPMDNIVEIDTFRRYELDVPVLFGWSWDTAHVWFGPKILVSRYTTGMSAHFVDEERLVDVKGTSIYYGGQFGAAIGYKHVWIGLELTLAALSGAATLSMPAAGSSTDAEFGGLVVNPTFGILAEF